MQEYWNGLLFASPGDLPNPRIEPMSPVSPALQMDSLSTKPLGKPYFIYSHYKILVLFSVLYSISL